MREESFFDAGPGPTGGIRVIHVRPDSKIDVTMDTAQDVAAAAKLSGVAVRTSLPQLKALCRAYGVRLVEREDQP